ncbi:MAG: hypothetical protein V1933_01100, partial [Candidatus Omnitrophota bacterium]
YIFCFKDSGISPSDILIFFLFSDGAKFHIYRRVINLIEIFGFRWVCLGKVFSDIKAPVWYPKKFYMETRLKNNPKSPLEEWIHIVGKRLIKDVSYWRSFIREFNVKLMFVKDERLPETIAQNIAFEIAGDKGGFLCGHQRSELSYPAGSLLGSHPKNILFTWSDRSRDYFNQNLDPLLANVITGYSFDVIYKSASGDIKNRVDALRAEGIKIVVTLFDNVHGGMSNPISTPLIKEFYEVFLNWALEDRETAILIKSKKRLVLDKLDDIRELIKKAQEAGRCLIVEENKLPTEVSRFSDFAVGIGISTSVTESALAGCRGIHCDLTGLKSHHFYKWGSEKIIFSSAVRLVAALKRYKDDPKNEPDLGDWSSYMDMIDPFRDGKAGERSGSYMRWLLEGFRKGIRRREVIDYANNLYSQKWAKNKE